MATFTTKLGLRKPASSDNVDVLQDLSNNWDKVDANVGRFICTSSTRPSGGDRFVGQTIFETDTTEFRMWDGTTWQLEGSLTSTQYTPTMTGVTLGNGNLYAKWKRSGKWVNSTGRLLFGSTTTVAAGPIYISLPFTSTPALQNRNVGGATCIDASAGTGATRIAHCSLDTDNRFLMYLAAGGLVGNTDPFTWANNDILEWNINYEVL